MINAQEQFWQGEDGNNYLARHDASVGAVENMKSLFGRIFGPRPGKPMKAVIELGVNTGVNMVALHQYLESCQLPDPVMHGVEINAEAATRSRYVCDNVANCSVLDPVEINTQLGGPWDYDLVMTKGLLIHIAPDDLAAAYSVIHSLARRYILIAEYYSPRVEMIEYRGQYHRLWRAPYAEQMLNHYGDLSLLDYGFVSKLDAYPLDDITWWLMEKR